MARGNAVSRDLPRATASGHRVTQPGIRWALSTKVVLSGVGIVILLGMLTFAMVREVTTRGVATSAPPQPTVSPRPPLTAAEETYAHVLWPIHADVKLGALRMMFAGINYKLRKIDRAELKAIVEASNDIYRRADRRVRTFQPPSSLQETHAYYLDALRLYRQAAAEMLKVFDDGRDEHLVAASPLVKAAGQNLEAVAIALWPGEYVPN